MYDVVLQSVCINKNSNTTQNALNRLDFRSIVLRFGVDSHVATVDGADEPYIVFVGITLVLRWILWNMFGRILQVQGLLLLQ